MKEEEITEKERGDPYAETPRVEIVEKPEPVESRPAKDTVTVRETTTATPKSESRLSPEVDIDTLEEIFLRLKKKRPTLGTWHYVGWAVVEYLATKNPGFNKNELLRKYLLEGLKRDYPELYKAAEEIYLNLEEAKKNNLAFESLVKEAVRKAGYK